MPSKQMALFRSLMSNAKKRSMCTKQLGSLTIIRANKAENTNRGNPVTDIYEAMPMGIEKALGCG